MEAWILKLDSWFLKSNFLLNLEVFLIQSWTHSLILEIIIFVIMKCSWHLSFLSSPLLSSKLLWINLDSSWSLLLQGPYRPAWPIPTPNGCVNKTCHLPILMNTHLPHHCNVIPPLPYWMMSSLSYKIFRLSSVITSMQWTHVSHALKTTWASFDVALILLQILRRF